LALVIKGERSDITMDKYCPIVDYSEGILFKDQIFSNPCINDSLGCFSEVGYSMGHVKSLEVFHTSLSLVPCGIVGQVRSRYSPDSI
jgi:hypothetical protein